jgi:hypothetical protein
VPQLTSPHKQYLGSFGSTGSSSAPSSAALRAAAFFPGFLVRLPILMALPPSRGLVTGPGAGLLPREPASVDACVADAALARRGRSLRDGSAEWRAEARREDCRETGRSCVGVVASEERWDGGAGGLITRDCRRVSNLRAPVDELPSPESLMGEGAAAAKGTLVVVVTVVLCGVLSCPRSCLRLLIRRALELGLGVTTISEWSCE